MRVGVNVAVTAPDVAVTTTGTVKTRPLLVMARVRSRVTTHPALEYSWMPASSGSTSVNALGANAYPVGRANPAGKVTVSVVGVLPAASVTVDSAPEAVAPTRDHDRS